jgi:hypothetical protein
MYLPQPARLSWQCSGRKQQASILRHGLRCVAHMVAEIA